MKAYQLYDAIISICSITCDKCNKTDSCQVEYDYSMDHFYSEGWRRPRTLTYCPKCVKKYLKKK